MTLRVLSLRYLKTTPRSLTFQFLPRFELFSTSSKMGKSVKFESDSTATSQRKYSQNWGSSNAKVSSLEPVELAKSIFFEGLKSVIPSRLIPSKVQLQGSLLKLQDDSCTTIDLSQYNKKYVVGFGKACLPMAESLLVLLNGLVDRCIISVPFGTRACLNSLIEVHRGAKNNIPDEDAFNAAKSVVQLVRSCKHNDLLIVLISGGGSALLPYPIPTVTLEEKQNLIKSLSRAGCTINELNTVRKRLSLVKGGGLVQICQAGKIVSLIISDVTGSPLDVIASGPTVPNLDPINAPWNIIEKYGLARTVAPNIVLCPEIFKCTTPNSINFIKFVARNALSTDCPVQKKEKFDNVTNFIVGDNGLALEAAANAAKNCGLHPFIITSKMAGEAERVGYDLATLAESFARCLKYSSHEDSNVKPNLDIILRIFKEYKCSAEGIIPEIFEEHAKSTTGICLLFGGETTVTVRGTGEGGRNQESALSAGIRLDICRNLPHVKNKVAILCAGTDGFDVPNTAAGAVIEGPTMHKAQIQGISPLEYLRDNNSFNFFRTVANGMFHIVCGHTETNVMDIAIIVILKKEAQKSTERSSTKSML